MVIHQNRDMGVNSIEARRNHVCYGMGIGVIIVDEVYPGFPGDVRNASAYPFPVQYEIAEGLDSQALVADDNSSCRAPIIRAAKKLERMGCRAIAAECGYFAYFQQDVEEQVDVPVFMSALLQVPFMQRVISPDKLVGILTPKAQFLTPTMLRSVGIDPDSNIVIGGADDLGVKEFDRLYHADPQGGVVPGASYDKAQDELVRASSAFVAAHPKIGALLLTCTGYPPFARAVQRAIDLPLFSWGTLLDYAYSVVVHRDYYGHV
jgi:hypothetical protein